MIVFYMSNQVKLQYERKYKVQSSISGWEIVYVPEETNCRGYAANRRPTIDRYFTDDPPPQVRISRNTADTCTTLCG